MISMTKRKTSKIITNKLRFGIRLFNLRASHPKNLQLVKIQKPMFWVRGWRKRRRQLRWLRRRLWVWAGIWGGPSRTIMISFLFGISVLVIRITFRLRNSFRVTLLSILQNKSNSIWISISSGRNLLKKRKNW